MNEGYSPITYVYNFAGCPTAWEYKWILPSELSPRIMNGLGKIGWEFVGTLGGDWAIFKRPLPGEALEEQPESTALNDVCDNGTADA